MVERKVLFHINQSLILPPNFFPPVYVYRYKWSIDRTRLESRVFRTVGKVRGSLSHENCVVRIESSPRKKPWRAFLHRLLSSFTLRFSLAFALLSEFVEPQFLRVIGRGEADFVSTPFISGDTFSICRPFKQLRKKN